MRLIYIYFLLLLGVCTSALASQAGLEQNANKPLIFGFLPILSTEKMVARFGPLTDYLTEKLARPVRFETAPDYAEFVRRTNVEKRYDLLFTAPHFYYLAQRKAAYEVIARVNAPEMKAILVVKRNGTVKSVKDLRGRKITVPDSLSLANILIRDHLLQAGLNPDKDLTLVTTPSHSAALVSAYKDISDAAGIMIPPLRSASADIKNSMQVIATTRGTPHMPVSVAGRLSSNEKNKIRRILLELNKTSQGQKLLKQMAWPGFSATSRAEYDQLEWAAKLLQ